MTRRLYPILVKTVISTLKTIFEEGKYADKAIQAALKDNPKAGSKDRAFIAETTYEVVRWWRYLWALAGKEPSTDELYLWEVIGIYWLRAGNELPEWKEFSSIDIPSVGKRAKEAEKSISIKESVPDWLTELCNDELGEEQWAKEITAMNKGAKVYLRTNTLKTTLPDLQKALSDENVIANPIEAIPTCLELEERSNLFRLDIFKKGWFEMQDAGSQNIGDYLDVQPGMRVIDACAGAGGKTLQLAASMENKGRIIAMDTETWKLEELKRRTKRAGAGIVETKTIKGTKTIKRLDETADRLLLDVPCSGLGVLKRNPDAKWKLDHAFLKRIKETQKYILDYYPRMLKKGGLMVYATCSILPSENSNQVKLFLENHPDFELIKENQLFPSEDGYDGFYMALMKKN